MAIGSYKRTNAAILPLLLMSAMLVGCLGLPEDVADDGGAGPGPIEGNTAPSISGNPANAVMTDTNYLFIPSADDVDGDPLSFDIQNLPVWASFNVSTGKLFGQPTLEHVGVYESIGVSVSDGTHATAMPDFSITVSEVALGSMTLTWTLPTENSDGSLLTDLAGYKVYYGLSEGNYPNWIRIDNPSISTFVIENLLPDTYYVVATAFNDSGIESFYSNVAVKTAM